MAGSSSFLIERVVELGNGRKAAVTSSARNQLNFALFAGDRVTLMSPISEEVEFQVMRLVQFAPSAVTDRLIFEIPMGTRTDLAGWAGRKKL